MGSLLIILGLVVGFLLLYLTYRAGFAAGRSESLSDREELERLKDRIDFLQADNDSLLRRVRKQRETISLTTLPPFPVFGQSSLNPEAEQKKTAALRDLVDSVRVKNKSQSKSAFERDSDGANGAE